MLNPSKGSKYSGPFRCLLGKPLISELTSLKSVISKETLTKRFFSDETNDFLTSLSDDDFSNVEVEYKAVSMPP
jgi:hypothetical protein